MEESIASTSKDIIFVDCSDSEDELIEVNAILDACKKPFRNPFRKDLFEWEMVINKTVLPVPWIRVVNEVDNTPPPAGELTIIEDYCMDSVPATKPIFGCECTDCGTSAKCCQAEAACGFTDKKIQYNEHGILNMNFKGAIYECNDLCKCKSSNSCINRVVQKGRKVKLEIFRTEKCGWGVRSLDDIKKGQFVIEYLGEIIDESEVRVREDIYDYESCSYLFNLDVGDSKSPYVVDAASYGNASRFINHSCCPNLQVFPVFINQLSLHLPRLAIFARKNIPKETELTIDYKMKKPKQSSKSVKCYCGAKRCRKTMQ